MKEGAVIVSILGHSVTMLAKRTKKFKHDQWVVLIPGHSVTMLTKKTKKFKHDH